MKQPRPLMLAGFLLLCAAFKLVPYVMSRFGLSIDPETTYYPWNFSPILPLCLFGAVYFGERKWSYFIPLAAWFAGDLGIWALTGKGEFAFYGGEQLLVYLSFALVISLGFVLRKRRSYLWVAGTGFAGATLFFLVSNFGVWLFGGELRYPHTLAGLWECYVAAIPFYRNSLISMAVFLPVLFSPLTLRQSLSIPAQAPVAELSATAAS